MIYRVKKVVEMSNHVLAGLDIKAFFKEHPESELTVLKVDYDKQKEWVKHFKAFRQSTLIRYKGDKEIGRKIAETDQRKLFNLFTMKAK